MLKLYIHYYGEAWIYEEKRTLLVYVFSKGVDVSDDVVPIDMIVLKNCNYFDITVSMKLLISPKQKDGILIDLTYTERERERERERQRDRKREISERLHKNIVLIGNCRLDSNGL